MNLSRRQLKKHKRVYQAGREARLAGILWHENPYGYPGDTDSFSRSRSWSMGWLAQARELEMEARHKQAADREVESGEDEEEDPRDWQDCPSCGSRCSDTRQYGKRYALRCGVCGFKGPLRKQPARAITAWNKLPSYDGGAIWGERIAPPVRR